MLIKLWDWEKKWQCSQVFEGHSHYVMMIVLNPKDNNQFVSASLDRTIKVSSKGKIATLYILSCPILPCRCGSWALPSPTSPSRATRRASTVWTTFREETNLTSYQEQTTGQQIFPVFWCIHVCFLSLHILSIIFC